jgi:hypothetical protein
MQGNISTDFADKRLKETSVIVTLKNGCNAASEGYVPFRLTIDMERLWAEGHW